MDRVERVPIKKPAESGWVEDCCLPNHRAMVGWFNFELKPRTAGHFHLRHEVQPAVRLNTLDSPEIQSIASYQRLRITATPAESHATHKKIEESSDLPQETGKVPSVRTSNPLDGSKG